MKATVKTAAKRGVKAPTKAPSKPASKPPAKAAPKPAASKAKAKAPPAKPEAKKPAPARKPAPPVAVKAKVPPAKAPPVKAQVKPMAPVKVAPAKPLPKVLEKVEAKPAVKPAKSKAKLRPLTADYRPSDDEDYMNETHLAYFRRLLETWRADILTGAKQTINNLQEESISLPDIVDRASSESDKAIELRTRDRQRKLISKIDSALRRIEDGSYGYCEVTGEPIGIRRLEARPTATLSLEAQERHEKRERTLRDD